MKNKVSPLYMLFGVIFTTCLLVSNIIASKQVVFFNWTLTAAVLCFPISYILSDVVTEVYGFVAARRVIWIAFAMNVFMVIIFQLAMWWQSPAWYTNSTGFAATLGNTPRMLIASLLAYLIGSWVNAVVISRMKVSANGKHFGVRAILSTLFGETVDSLIFIPLAFIGVLPWEQMPMMIALQVLAKTMYEIIMLPITSQLVKKVKAFEGVDVYDTGIKRGLI